MAAVMATQEADAFKRRSRFIAVPPNNALSGAMLLLRSGSISRPLFSFQQPDGQPGHERRVSGNIGPSLPQCQNDSASNLFSSGFSGHSYDKWAAISALFAGATQSHASGLANSLTISAR
jgi:hypothetical protein